MRDTEYGAIKPRITMEKPNLIYDVCKVDVDGNVETIILKKGVQKIEPTVDVISSEATRVKYVVISQNGRKQNTIDFLIEKNPSTHVGTSTTEIEIDMSFFTFCRPVQNRLRLLHLLSPRGKSGYALLFHSKAEILQL